MDGSASTKQHPAPVIGIIGGSGLYEIDGLTDTEWLDVASPFGQPSDQLLAGTLEGVRVVFLPRHGRGHRLSPTAIILTGFLFGGFAIPIYSLSVAHANDLAQPDEFVEVAAGLFFVYGVGAMVGPLLGAGAVALLGPQALFWYTSSVHGCFLLFTVYRIGRRPQLPTTGREGFVGLIRTSPGIFKLDPRGRGRK